MESKLKLDPPRGKEDRVILQFDYDCFYAQVVENQNPSLKSKPLGIQQKNILATCNYNARRLGVRKLMLITEAKQLCPELVIVKGEDLTPFRDTSKVLFNFLRSQSWNKKVERLGFDEVFMDVTDIIEYNLLCLNKGSLASSFFQLSKTDPELGFECDLTSIAGCVEGDEPKKVEERVENALYLRLLLGSHFAQHLRQKLEADFGYTSTCGISINKALSKLVGTKNKPRNQTTLVALTDEATRDFIGRHTLRQVSGMGGRMVSILESHVLGPAAVDDSDSNPFSSKVTVKQLLQHQNITPSTLEKLLGGPGAEKGIGRRTWALLNGVDPTPVKEASDVPSQISIEDTYKGLETTPQIYEAMFKLSISLIRRMRIDLLSTEVNAEEGVNRWIARPKTIRLAIRSWPQNRSQARDWHRTSRSTALPNFIFNLVESVESIAEKLLNETLVPLLRRLENEKGPKWNLQLINICVANMEAGAGNEKTGAGRDISTMFKHQDELLLPWKVTDFSDNEASDVDITDVESDGEEAQPWEDSGGLVCSRCKQFIPLFATAAHARYHELEERE